MGDDLAVADLLFAARARVDAYWNFQVLIVLAIIGWMVSLKRTLLPPMKVLVSVAFGIASTANLIGLYSAYTLAEALRTDLLRVSSGTQLHAARAILQEHSYLAHRTAAVWMHLGIGASVLFVVWFVRFSGTGERGDGR